MRSVHNTISIGTHKDDLETPILVIDLDVMERNLRRMADFMATVPANLRPHSKTHKTPALAHLQLAAGAVGICCASLPEAEVMLGAGIRDILVTREIVQSGEIARAACLAREADLIVIVDDAGIVDHFSQACVRAGVELRVLVDVDVRLGRSGVQPGAAALALAQRVEAAPGLRFAGLMGYEGGLHSFEPAERERLAREALGRLIETKDLLERSGIPVSIVSAGGTTTYRLTGAFPGITEIQAGTYLTGDGRSSHSQPDFEPAVSVLTTVVSHPHPGRVTTDAGEKKLTADWGLPRLRGPAGLTLTALNEEHGILDKNDADLTVRVGDRLEMIPSHGGTTINLYDQWVGLRGDTVEVIWDIAARGA